MAETITKIAFFTISDWKEEERWLREQANQGLHLRRMVVPCFYIFEKGEAEDVIYRLDFTNNDEKPDYRRMLEDYGWENCGKCAGWLYWRKRAAEAENTPACTSAVCTAAASGSSSIAWMRSRPTSPASRALTRALA